MKLSYSIENIRRITSIPQIEMRPITILVGRNSAGKSTYLRSLPLIRQSLETRSSAPILWFGELVDFGDPNTAIGEGADKGQAAFRFTIFDLHQKRRRSNFHYYYRYYGFHRTIEVSQVSIRYVIGTRDDETILQTIEVEIPNEEIDVCIDFGLGDEDPGRIKINGILADFLPKNYKIETVETNLFSPPFFVYQSKDKEDKPRSMARRSEDVLADVLKNVLSRGMKRKLSDSTYRKEIRRILSANRFDSSSILAMANSSDTMSFKEIYRDLASGRDIAFRNQVFSIRRLARTFSVLEVLEDLLTEYFLNVGYLEPVRAASERFYRKQELEVSEIAPNGSNFPMFLASLAPEELDEFSSWVNTIFGYGVGVHRTEGHISIHLHSGKRSVNVTDTGYGVCQILPVLGIIWWAQNKRNVPSAPRRYRSGLRTLAIEQPELHLHPAHQAKLADVFVAAIQRNQESNASSEIRLMVETHSEALVNRLGELVEEGKIHPDAIQIVIFSAKEDLNSPSEVSISRFDDTGALENWPFGFFNYSEK